MNPIATSLKDIKRFVACRKKTKIYLKNHRFRYELISIRYFIVSAEFVTSFNVEDHGSPPALNFFLVLSMVYNVSSDNVYTAMLLTSFLHRPVIP